MEKLRKQIRESFFNPVVHFFPLLSFLIVDELFGINLAWKISFPLAIGLLVYIYYSYNRIFTWHLMFTILFFVVSIIASFELIFPIPVVFHNLIYEIVFLLFLSIYLLFRKQIQLTSFKFMSKLIPMSNNFSELQRVVWELIVVLLLYIGGTIILFYNGLGVTPYQQLLHFTYLGLLVFLVVYEMIRVQIIRSKLTREEWWPIVSEQGKIIGSIQHLTSINDDKKYMHPIVRVMFIDKSMILLQKRSLESVIYPGMWDTALSNHVNMGETIEEAIDRTAQERYSIDNFKYMYLANYTLEVEKEHHYAFLFVSCLQAEFKLNTVFTDKLKWWTQQQIEEDLEAGVFTENFKVEYDLLKRSGLLETGKCNCTCKLKEVIFEQSNAIKKE